MPTLDLSALLKLQNGSDIRGVAMEGVDGEPVTLTAAAVCRIGAAFVRWLAQKSGKSAHTITIAIGSDSRLTADALRKEAASGALTESATVLDCGLSSTPAMFMATHFEEILADGAIMLTASHLPFNRNGMKFFTPAGGLEKGDIKEILTLAADVRPGATDRTARPCALLARYARFLRDTIKGALATDDPKPLAGHHIIVDAGNGAGGFFATDVLAPLGADITGSRYLAPDGNFPNHVPNPENAAAMAAIKDATIESDAELGLIFDTDVDRMSAVLPGGIEIARNGLIAMIAAILAQDYPGSTIVTDSVTSDELTDFLENTLHLRHHRFRRGYRNVINECIRLNDSGTVSPLAIETSGHGALKENYYLDDGAYLAVKLIIAAAKYGKDGKSPADLVKDLRHPAEAAEIRLKIEGTDDAQAVGKSALTTLTARAEKAGIPIATPSYEGVRLIFQDGWALLRMSLHDPEMPLNIEGKHAGSADAIREKLRTLLANIDHLNLEKL